jgi:hypothetical protein
VRRRDGVPLAATCIGLYADFGLRSELAEVPPPSHSAYCSPSLRSYASGLMYQCRQKNCAVFKTANDESKRNGLTNPIHARTPYFGR